MPAIAVALNLALDASRGRELLNGWDPDGATVPGDPISI